MNLENQRFTNDVRQSQFLSTLSATMLLRTEGALFLQLTVLISFRILSNWGLLVSHRRSELSAVEYAEPVAQSLSSAYAAVLGFENWRAETVQLRASGHLPATLEAAVLFYCDTKHANGYFYFLTFDIWNGSLAWRIVTKIPQVFNQSRACR
jgi:hypothetical protein